MRYINHLFIVSRFLLRVFHRSVYLNLLLFFCRRGKYKKKLLRRKAAHLYYYKNDVIKFIDVIFLKIALIQSFSTEPFNLRLSSWLRHQAISNLFFPMDWPIRLQGVLLYIVPTFSDRNVETEYALS